MRNRLAKSAFCLVLASCAGGFSPIGADGRADIANHAAALAKCQAEGKAAHSFVVYAECKKREGIQ